MPKRHREIISRAELARRGGRTKSCVTMACRPGGELASAVVGRGVDAGHPAVVNWLGRSDPAKTSTRKKGNSEAESGPEFDRQVREMALRKRQAETEFLEHRARVARGEYIAIDLVTRTVFSHLEMMSRRLLSDVPATLALRVERLSREERVLLIRETISRELTFCRDQTIKSLGVDRRALGSPPEVKNDD
jgi:hypothetical protein